MLGKVIYSAVKERKITFFIAIAFVILGFYSYYINPKQESPDINVPVAVVNTIYPGASPEDVERLVTSKIEDKLVEIKGYKFVESHSRNNISTVVFWIETGIEVDKAWEELRQKMGDLQRELPKECLPIQILTNLDETAGMIISISGGNYSYNELAALAEDLKNDLSKIEGISRFEVTGKQEQQVTVNVDISKLNYYGLSLNHIAQIIQAQSVEIPSGMINDNETKINVHVPGSFETLQELENTVLDVSPTAGVAVRLKDLADIYFDYEDSNYKIKQNGNNAVLLTGYFKANENILITGKEVEKTINAYKAKLPADIAFDEILYQPKDVKHSINNFILNLIEGMFFVIIVIFWGMGVRNAIVVSTVIPLTILITFSSMYLLGIKIHQISIAALIIALGMLVDNAIVISDSIQVRLDNEQERMTACVEGVREVALPVLASTLTTVGAFIPLLLLPGVAGEYVSSLPQIVILSLTFSYLVALFITPSLAFVFFKKSPSKERLTSLRTFFANSLNKAMEARKLTIMLSVVTLFISIFLATKMGLQFFPKADNNILYVDIKTEQNNDLAKTEALSNEVALILQGEPEILTYTEAIGNSLPKFFTTLPLYTPSPNFAQIMCRVDLKEGKRFKTNTQLLDHLQNIIDNTISGGTATVKQLEQGEPIGNPIRIRLTGEDMDGLEIAAMQVENRLAAIDGTVNVGNDFSKKIYEYLVKIDVDKASHYGITKYDVQRDVNTALSGNEASVFRKAGNEYKIIVKGNISSKEDLENLGISSDFAGHKVILKEIAEIGLKSSIPNIKRHEREREITVFSDVKAGYSPAKIEQEFSNLLSDLDLEGISVNFDGEKAKIIQYFGDIGILAIFAGLVIFIVLLFEFKNFAQPFVILLAIPLSFIGAIWALFITRMPLSFTSVLGMVSLMGIVVNNAIVLLDYLNAERRKGVPLETACKTAAEKRFRPIILTTITTIVALTPLIIGGDNLFAPMSISLFGGLLVSTMLTLIVVPVVYAEIESRIDRDYEIANQNLKTWD